MLIRRSSVSPPPHPATAESRRCVSRSLCSFDRYEPFAWYFGLSLSTLRRIVGISESPELLRLRRACHPFIAATLLLDFEVPIGDEAMSAGKCCPRVDNEVSSARGRKSLRAAMRWGLGGVSWCWSSWCDPASLIVSVESRRTVLVRRTNATVIKWERKRTKGVLKDPTEGNFECDKVLSCYLSEILQELPQTQRGGAH